MKITKNTCLTLLLLLAPSIWSNSCNASTLDQTANLQQKSVQKINSAYLNYVPFEWETIRAITAQELIDGVQKAIDMGVDKSQNADTDKSITQLTSPSDIKIFKSLLIDRHNLPKTMFLGEPRLLFEPEDGSTKIFVYADGTASQGSNKWRLSAADFAQLKKELHRIYPKAI